MDQPTLYRRSPTIRPPQAAVLAATRMTSVLSRSSWVSRRRRWIRASGSEEPVTDDPAA